ncbi:MAG: ATP-binding protein [Pseudomonadota bacterium]
MNSLRLSIVVSAGSLLVIFVGVAIGVLDDAFRKAAMKAEEARLDVQLISLLAAAKPSDDYTLTLPDQFPEPRYAQPLSGLYAAVFDRDGREVWKSDSTIGVVVPWVKSVPVGQMSIVTLAPQEAAELLSFSMGITWDFDDGTTRPFTFHVAESFDFFNDQVSAYRRQLFGWFIGVGIALLVSLGGLLGWLLRPLAQIEEEIGEIEQGERETLSAGYPDELAGAARNLNALVRRERSRGEVYRRTLGDLAHSLKTPLATLRTLLRHDNRDDIDRELTRMDETIRYQLAKPATRGRLIGTKPFDVPPAIDALLASFAKIYADKSVTVQTSVAPALRFRGDPSDFTELVGNVLDNAFKRCQSAVWLRVEREASGAFVIDVSDDGPGFPEPLLASQEIVRGQRLDEAPSSQGLGLAIVAEICELYGASLRLANRDGGGARVTIAVPNP